MIINNKNTLAIGREIYQDIVKMQPKSVNWKDFQLFQAIKKYTPTVRSISRYDRNGNFKFNIQNI